MRRRWRLFHASTMRSSCFSYTASRSLPSGSASSAVRASPGVQPIRIPALRNDSASLDCCKHRYTRINFCDIVDQFLDDNCFTNTSSAKQTDLTTFCIGFDEVDNFNSGI